MQDSIVSSLARLELLFEYNSLNSSEERETVMMKINLLPRPRVYICPPSDKYERLDKNYCKAKGSIRCGVLSRMKSKKEFIEDQIITNLDQGITFNYGK